MIFIPIYYVNMDCLNALNTVNLPRNHPCFVIERTKISGLFSDKTNEKTINFVCCVHIKSLVLKKLRL